MKLLSVSCVAAALAAIMGTAIASGRPHHDPHAHGPPSSRLGLPHAQSNPPISASAAHRHSASGYRENLRTADHWWQAAEQARKLSTVTSGNLQRKYTAEHNHAKMKQDLYEGQAKLYRGDTITFSQEPRSSGTVEPQKGVDIARIGSVVSAQMSLCDAQKSIKESGAHLERLEAEEAAHGLLSLHQSQHTRGGRHR